ncbi:MAG: hypothetical protein BMS9Abin07_0215 [Acidimicrobiia bacterium]|nr:MAG: hypothetical protein BMS9Abin07_0215 [Acidimicrobiia bacterium]
MKLMLALVDRWWAKRFHPWAQLGFDTMVEGSRRGDNIRTAAGLAMLVAGMSRRRGPRRRLIYSADIEAGRSIGIRVSKRGAVVGEFEIPAPGS